MGQYRRSIKDRRSVSVSLLYDTLGITHEKKNPELKPRDVPKKDDKSLKYSCCNSHFTILHIQIHNSALQILMT